MKIKGLCCFFLILSCFIVFVWSGSTVSGFHFMDDHLFVSIYDELENVSRGTFTVAAEHIKNDIYARFRPFDCARWVVETKVFGLDFTTRAVFRFVLAFISLCFFAVFWSALLKNYWLGALFSIFTIFGPQASMWWMLGPAEAWGVFFVSAALCLCAHNPPKRTFLNRAGFFALVLLSTLCKESFILFAPAAYAIYVYFEHKNGEQKLGVVIRKNLPFGLLMAVVVLAELYIILSFVGTEKIGYAGVQTKSAWQYIEVFIRLIGTNPATSATMFLSLLLVIAAPRSAWYSLKMELNNIVWLTMLASLVIIPQIALYAKSGIFGRYLLPAMIGVNFFLCGIFAVIIKSNAFLQKGLGNSLLRIFAVIGSAASAIVLFSEPAKAKILALLGNMSRAYTLSSNVRIIWLEKWSGIVSNVSLIILVVFLVLLFLTFITAKKRIKISTVALCCVMLAAMVTVWNSYQSAEVFAAEGIATNQFLSKIGESTNENSKILIVSEPAINYEWTYSLRTYIELVHKRKNVKNLLTISDIYKQDEFMMSLRQALIEDVKDTTVDNIDGFDCIAILPAEVLFSNENMLVEKFPVLSSSNYKKEEFAYPAPGLSNEGVFVIYSAAK